MTAKAKEMSPRKQMLFGCACVRHVWHLIEDERTKNMVDVVERYADGSATYTDLMIARRVNHQVREDTSIRQQSQFDLSVAAECIGPRPNPIGVANAVISAIYNNLSDYMPLNRAHAVEEEQAWQDRLLRHINGTRP